MKPSGVFWGSLLVFLGIFFLLSNFDIVMFEIDWIVDLWPLILVFWGVALLKLPLYVKNVMAGLSAVLISMIIISVIHHNWSWNFDSSCDDDKFASESVGEFETNHLMLPFDSTLKTGTFNFKGGAGEFNLEGITDELVEVKAVGLSDDKLQIEKGDSSGSFDIDFVYDVKNKFLKHISHDRKARIKLNPVPVWDFRLKVGATDFECDLSSFKSRNISLNSGAADIELVLGDLYDAIELDINAGASNVEIKVPRSSGCFIDSKTGLSSKDFYGFSSLGGGEYKTDNFDVAEKKIHISISGGVSNFEVERY